MPTYKGRPGRPGRVPQVHNVTLPKDRAGLEPTEVAHLLGISRTQVYTLLQQGEFVSFHIGRKHRILADSVTDFINRRVAAESRSA